MFNWFGKLLYGHKHKFVNKTQASACGFSWPVYECELCKQQLHLDDWQMADLPASMAYGCKGK